VVFDDVPRELSVQPALFPEERVCVVDEPGRKVVSVEPLVGRFPPVSDFGEEEVEIDVENAPSVRPRPGRAPN
jgi:hypothetical protein